MACAPTAEAAPTCGAARGGAGTPIAGTAAGENRAAAPGARWSRRRAVDVLKLLQLHPQRGGLLVLAGSYRDTAYLDRVHPERVEHRLDVQPLRGEQAGRRLDALAPACARRPRGRLGARPGRWWSGGRR